MHPGLVDLTTRVTRPQRNRWATRTIIRTVELRHTHGAIVKLSPLPRCAKENVWDLAREPGFRRLRRSPLMPDGNFRDELDGFMRDELHKSDSLRRVLALTEAETDYVGLSDDDLVYLVADVLGTLREALLRVGSEIDAIHRKLDSPPG